MPLADPSAYLIDLDGTLYAGGAAIPGAVAAIERLRAGGIPFRLVTNTTSRSRAMLVQAAGGVRLPHRRRGAVHRDDRRGRAGPRTGLSRDRPVPPEAALEDIDRARSGGRDLRAAATLGLARRMPCMVGDLGERWTYDLMQEAFEYLMAGAELIALSRDRYWLRDGRLALDAGPFVAGLEYASGPARGRRGQAEPALLRRGRREPGRGRRPTRSPWSATTSGRTCRARSGPGSGAGWSKPGSSGPDVLARGEVVPDRVLASVALLGEG